MLDNEPPDLDEPPELDEEQSNRLRRMAIQNCAMCDHDGYRPDGVVCHHNPRQDETNRRGSQLVRETMNFGKPKPPASRDMVDVIQQQRELGPPQQLSDEEEPEL